MVGIAQAKTTLAVVPMVADEPIRVGLLHSLTGPMAPSEAPLIEAAQMAIDEINAAGGVLGRPLAAVVGDGGSAPAQFKAAAAQLLAPDSPQPVVALFGCWASMGRKAVLPVLAAHNRLLWYPVHYEGLEQSPWVFYTGSCLNQQVEPALDWLLGQGRRRFFLVGSDHLFPRVTNKVLKGQLEHRQDADGAAVVGEAYLPLGTTDFKPVVETLLSAQPDVVFNTLNGASNLPFYRQCHALGITADRLPILTVSIGEQEWQALGPTAAGHYACWSYFQSLDTAANRAFVERFRRRYGAHRVTSDSIEAAYTQVYLWRAAVTAAQTTDTEAVRRAAIHQHWESPVGPVCCEANHHLQKPCHVGQAQADGQFRIVYSSPGLLRPLPWLGMEQQSFAAAAVVMDMLGEVSNAIQSSWELEQALAQRQRAEAALRAANAEITSLNRALAADNSRLSAELSVAQQLQQMVLPRPEELRAIADLDIAGFMEAAAEVGGDYYDVLATADGQRVTLAMGDVTGHGLESGVLMIMAQTAVRTLHALGLSIPDDPAQVLQALNDVIYRNRLRMGSHRNLSLVLLDYHRGTLTLSGQHEEVIVVRANGTVERIDTLDLGYPLGLVPDIAPFVAQQRLALAVGDGVVIYTDGITEAENAQRQLYGQDRLLAAVQQVWGQTAQAIQRAVLADVRSHIGPHTVYDDITLVVVKRVA